MYVGESVSCECEIESIFVCTVFGSSMSSCKL